MLFERKLSKNMEHTSRSLLSGSDCAATSSWRTVSASDKTCVNKYKACVWWLQVQLLYVLKYSRSYDYLLYKLMNLIISQDPNLNALLHDLIYSHVCNLFESGRYMYTVWVHTHIPHKVTYNIESLRFITDKRGEKKSQRETFIRYSFYNGKYILY